MKTVTLKLPDRLHKKLEREAKKKGLSKAAIVQAILENHLRISNGKRSLSCWELGKGIWGSLEGPGDLSFNKKYMEGFGK